MSIIGDLFSLGHAEPWQERALCAQSDDPDAFFPEKSEHGSKKAKAICGSREKPNCPVREQCLAYALEHDEQFGIWGGLTAYERYRKEGGIRPPKRRERTYCVNGHRVDGPGYCQQCNRNRCERYKARQRQGLVAPRWRGESA